MVGAAGLGSSCVSRAFIQHSGYIQHSGCKRHGRCGARAAPRVFGVPCSVQFTKQMTEFTNTKG